MQMSSKKKVIAVAITTVALTVGSVGISQAASKSKVVSTKITRTSTNGIANPMARGGGHAADLAATLSALVAKGTITQAQADAINAAAAAAETAKRAAREADRGSKLGHKEGKGGRGHGGPGMGGKGAAPKIPAPTVSPSSAA
jgi:hypothetical protein